MGRNVNNTLEQIEKVLNYPQIDQKVERYFSPSIENDHASDTFNTFGDNNPYSITSDDLLALTTLEVSVSPLTLRALLQDEKIRSQASGLLREIPNDIDLWEDGADIGPESVANQLWVLLKAQKSIGWVIAGKLLARKRPRLIPIYDEVVKDFFSLDDQFWITLREALRTNDLPERIEKLRPSRLTSPAFRYTVSTIRLLDVAIWMHEK